MAIMSDRWIRRMATEHGMIEPFVEAQKRAYAAATRLLGYPEEQVQGLALRWISQLPARESTLVDIKESLQDMVDPDLARLALLELRRHLGTPQEGAALDLVESLLFEGSIFASREIARSAGEKTERPSWCHQTLVWSRSATVGTTSRLRTMWSSMRPSVWPGAFTKNGTGAISSTLRSLRSRLLRTPTWNE